MSVVVLTCRAAGADAMVHVCALLWSVNGLQMMQATRRTLPFTYCTHGPLPRPLSTVPCTCGCWSHNNRPTICLISSQGAARCRRASAAVCIYAPFRTCCVL